MPNQDERVWSDSEVEILARAVIRAPSVHNIQPWSLNLPGMRAELSERTDLSLPEHDPTGRDRLISCGAALENLELAVRVLGWAIEVEMPPGQGPLVAVVTTSGREPPSGRELHAYAAISRRRSHRRPFAAIPVASSMLASVIGQLPRGVGCRVLSAGDKDVLAELLDQASKTIQSRDGLQRELEDWMGDRRSLGAGLGLPGYDKASLPWAGLIRRTSPTPNVRTLARRLDAESVLIFCAEDDGRAGHLATGVAVQRSWLAAVDGGLAASVLTRLLHEEPVRKRMTAELNLPGHPQLIMRLGYPDDHRSS
ncbi:nitroreductase [Amycolatopsis sp. WAC 04182]|uniref:Acg family FMN-binding oxidoreductase n=1 Tax=Amycolatopsis sp. WAC 04182 TaxID=2203198 RepID=UPI000F77A349|nr:nitroreductase family protein [Amycolatopsis sp. WAC 04182]RSN60932.1 nitroreductase [Amycolatopsis sp. WAC 04182]